MGWDWVEDACFPLFHCFFEMCVIPKSLLEILFFSLLVYIEATHKPQKCTKSVHYIGKLAQCTSHLAK